MNLQGKRIVLGVSGGVAAYKVAELARELQRRGARVQAVMTEAATRFVGTATFQALTGRPVYTDQWDTRIDNGMAHIDLTRDADAVLVAPASTNLMAKVANGLCDDLLSILCIARNCPLLLAPAMNREMWAHPATQRNVRTLRDDGVTILGPGSGDQACGETGDGRMLEALELADAVEAFFAPKALAGRRILMTAGPTYEPIDPVRGITNLSSGRMGFAIARACARAGAEVTLVAGPVSLTTPAGVQRIDVQTAVQMHRVVIDALDAAGEQGAAGGRNTAFDVFIAVAAVADWRVAKPSASKMKKSDESSLPVLSFAQNPDILAEVARRPDAPYCVGFAAESEDLEKNGAEKRARKGVPLLVGNIGHETFGRDENELLLIDERGSRRLPRASKNALGESLVEELASRLRNWRPRSATARVGDAFASVAGHGNQGSAA